MHAELLPADNDRARRSNVALCGAAERLQQRRRGAARAPLRLRRAVARPPEALRAVFGDLRAVLALAAHKVEQLLHVARSFSLCAELLRVAGALTGAVHARGRPVVQLAADELKGDVHRWRQLLEHRSEHLLTHRGVRALRHHEELNEHFGRVGA
eukprot:CAMPEP_0171077284 /NCGR_PEP_ID=MMETSP0766_2-20121228/13937_1 /TAXON_ID=439317 /ORGANISM="Gambierdiscus australes, Strain CAWD 149" /LENGTH=154 /DNA_ID=CAMNT_0011534327 /DNA_START=228 /DNA_END=689 /DNA_ORIENTATION=-